MIYEHLWWVCEKWADFREIFYQTS